MSASSISDSCYDSIDVSEILRTATSTSSELIGIEQLNQISSLQARIRSLEAELSSYKKWNAVLRAQLSGGADIVREIADSLSDALPAHAQIDRVFAAGDAHAQARELSAVVRRALTQRSAAQPFRVDIRAEQREQLLRRVRDSTAALRTALGSGAPGGYRSAAAREEQLSALIGGGGVSCSELVALLLREISVVDALCSRPRDEVRARAENEIKAQFLEKVTERYVRKLEAQIRREREPALRAAVDRELRAGDGGLAAAYASLSAARGGGGGEYSRAALAALCADTAAEIGRVRAQCGAAGQSASLTALFEGMRQQVQQLDQLQTQTRGLLVRQAEVISALRGEP